jgi:hypothetical protein
MAACTDPATAPAKAIFHTLKSLLLLLLLLLLLVLVVAVVFPFRTFFM